MSIPYVWTIPRALILAASTLKTAINYNGLPTSNSTIACQELQSELQPGQIVWPSNILKYQREINAYYSQACGDLLPRCILYPEDAVDVEKIFQRLAQSDVDVPFAVKSGGYNHNVGFNSVKDGILISLSRMRYIDISTDLSAVDIGPGARWGQVQEALDPLNLTVVGGRTSINFSLKFVTCELIANLQAMLDLQAMLGLVALS